VGWGLICVVASVGLGMRRDWGRGAAIIALGILLGACVVCAVCSTGAVLQNTFSRGSQAFPIWSLLVAYALLGGIFLGLHLVIRYLRSDAVRASFPGRNLPPSN